MLHGVLVYFFLFSSAIFCGMMLTEQLKPVRFDVSVNSVTSTISASF